MEAPGVVTSPDQEGVLVAGLRRQDEAAYEQVVRTFGGALLATAKRIMKCEDDARDVVQEAFLQVFRSIHAFEGTSRLGTWMHRITVNAALMKLRARSRRPEESIEPLLPAFSDDGHQAAPTRWRSDVVAQAERQELCSLVRAKIETLPDSYRTVLVLRDLEGLDTEETARVLETTPNAVKVRLHRARQALRTLLDGTFREGFL